MQFDPNNKVVKFCAQGMEMEGQGKPKDAIELFLRAWNESTNDFEKFTAAHYVARHQGSAADKLKWDSIALEHAMKIDDENMKGTFPSLYLNIGKCYEDLNDYKNAEKNYELAFSFIKFLADDGYGKMIKEGIMNGIKRIKCL